MGIQIEESLLGDKLIEKLEGKADASIRLESNFNVPIQYVVNIIDIVNGINQMESSNHKVVLATRPKG